MEAIRISIVNRSRITRVGIVQVLDSCDDLSVDSQYKNIEDAFPALARERPDIIVIDYLDTDECRGVIALKQVTSNSLIVISGVPLSSDCIIRCAQAGASAYIEPDASNEAWITAIKGAMQGEIHNPIIAGILNRSISKMHKQKANNVDAVKQLQSWRVPSQIEGSAKRVGLTPRERQIVSLIDRGLSNKEIARQLQVEPSTIKNHVHAILSKYNVHRRSEAAAQFRKSQTSTPSQNRRS